jgi:threonine/homoserine/homoserine lactone efflux protein
MVELATLYVIGLMGSAVPGPDILYITRTALDRGLVSGWIGASGVLFASLFYLTAAGMGLGAIGQHPYFQLAVGGVGSLYLLWIAKSIWNETLHMDNTHDKDPHKLHIFLKGMAVHLSNPKAIIFFSVILTPFLEKGNLPLQIGILTLGHTTTFFGVAFLVTRFDNVFTPQRARMINRASAVLFVVFALELIRNAWRAYEHIAF